MESFLQIFHRTQDRAVRLVLGAMLPRATYERVGRMCWDRELKWLFDRRRVCLRRLYLEGWYLGDSHRLRRSCLWSCPPPVCAIKEPVKEDYIGRFTCRDPWCLFCHTRRYTYPVFAKLAELFFGDERAAGVEHRIYTSQVRLYLPRVHKTPRIRLAELYDQTARARYLLRRWLEEADAAVTMTRLAPCRGGGYESVTTCLHTGVSFRDLPGLHIESAEVGRWSGTIRNRRQLGSTVAWLTYYPSRLWYAHPRRVVPLLELRPSKQRMLSFLGRLHANSPAYVSR